MPKTKEKKEKKEKSTDKKEAVQQLKIVLVRRAAGPCSCLSWLRRRAACRTRACIRSCLHPGWIVGARATTCARACIFFGSSLSVNFFWCWPWGVLYARAPSVPT